MKIDMELYHSIYVEERFERDGKDYARGMIIARPATGEDFERASKALPGDDEEVIKMLHDFGCVLLKESEVRITSSGKVVQREEWIETKKSLEYNRDLKWYSGKVYEIN